MNMRPPITIVVPCLNGASHLRETLASLADQAYPELDVVIEDGDSDDESVPIAEEFVRRYPRSFRAFAGSAAGPAQALNQGFAQARGEIFGFLEPGDVLLPGALESVAHEIAPQRERYVVMGRCLFAGAGLGREGIEYPAEFSGHVEFLAIWKHGMSTVPQPSVFWHRKVWERLGGFDAGMRHAYDYELFCRYSRHYWFHSVDATWSAMRIFRELSIGQCSEAHLLELCVAASRKHWGSWLTPKRWQCQVSHWVHSRHFHENARHHARRAESAFRERRRVVALVETLRTFLYSPSMARDRLWKGWLARVRARANGARP